MRGIAAKACLWCLCLVAPAAVIAACGDDARKDPNDELPIDAGAGRDASTDAAGQTGTVVLIGERDAGAAGAGGSGEPGVAADDMIVAGAGGTGLGGFGGAAGFGLGGIGPVGGAGGAGAAVDRLDGNAIAITSAQRILALDFVTAQVLGARELGGLNDGEVILAADVRTLDGELYAITSEARVVRIDLDSGEAHETAVLAADGEDGSEPFVALRGARFAADWDPVTDRLGLFSDADQRLQVDADTGMTRALADGISPAAYALDTADATHARLYALDRTTRSLFASPREQRPESAAMARIGELAGAGDADLVDFEIGATRSGALAPIAVVSDAESTRLLDVNLAAGDLTCPRTLALAPGETLIAFTTIPPRADQPAH